MENLFEKILADKLMSLAKERRSQQPEFSQSIISNATEEIVVDVDDSDVYELLNTSKDFAERHTAILQERLNEKIERAAYKLNQITTLHR